VKSNAVLAEAGIHTDLDATKTRKLGGKVPIGVGVTVELSMHMKNDDHEKYGLTKDRIGNIVGWKSNEHEPAHLMSHFAYVPDVIYVQFYEKDGKPATWKHPELRGRRDTSITFSRWGCLTALARDVKYPASNWWADELFIMMVAQFNSLHVGCQSRVTRWARLIYPRTSILPGL
jgi:hypothetical protein